MAREVDPKRTRKALRLVRRLAEQAETKDAASESSSETPVDYSGWEREFLSEVEGRLQKYGSAFANLSKGRPEEALSTLQTQKLREIAAKAAGKDKPRKGLSTKKPLRAKPPAWAKKEERD